MKRMSTIKKALEKLGYTVIEREDTLVLAQELQSETRTMCDENGENEIEYAPSSHDYTYDTQPSDELNSVLDNNWFWE